MTSHQLRADSPATATPTVLQKPAESPMHVLDLAHLLSQVAQQDHAAFASLYDALSPLVYGTSVRVLRNPALAEEVTQETFLFVWEHAARFDRSKGSPRSWIAKIAHSRAVDVVRHDQNAANREKRVAQSVDIEFDVVEETAHARDEAARVRAALSTLTDLQRESVCLAYYGGFTYRDVAGRLGVKNATVKTRIRDGLLRLHDSLEGGPAATPA